MAKSSLNGAIEQGEKANSPDMVVTPSGADSSSARVVLAGKNSKDLKPRCMDADQLDDRGRPEYWPERNQGRRSRSRRS